MKQLFILATALLAFIPSIARCADDKLRPQFHFTAAKGWLNDPNGLVYFDGEYHLFFQHTPDSTTGDGAKMNWGHAISTDLLHWQQLPDAIEKDDDGSIWSGSAVVDWQNTSGFGKVGKPPLVAMYTRAKDPFCQCIAYSTDRGRTWTKFSGNPVIPFINGANRDPRVIWNAEEKHWVVAIYLDWNHSFGLFTSPDLKTWKPLRRVTLDYDNECPDLFPLALDGDKRNPRWIFTAAGTHYVVGDFDGNQFVPQTDSIEGDRGPNYYAAQTFSDLPSEDGRRIQIGWMRDGRYPGMPFNQQMSFPSELTLRSTPRGPRVYRVPVREIEKLYTGQPHEWKNAYLAPDRDLLKGIKGELLDIAIDFEPKSITTLKLDIRGHAITFHNEGPAAGAIASWDRRNSLSPIDGHVKLRVLVDRTSIEIYANDGELVMSGCFLPPDDNQSVHLTTEGGEARIHSVMIHELNSARESVASTSQESH